jgi:hypothetical protein
MDRNKSQRMALMDSGSSTGNFKQIVMDSNNQTVIIKMNQARRQLTTMVKKYPIRENFRNANKLRISKIIASRDQNNSKLSNGTHSNKPSKSFSNQHVVTRNNILDDQAPEKILDNVHMIQVFTGHHESPSIQSSKMEETAHIPAIHDLTAEQMKEGMEYRSCVNPDQGIK